MNNLKTLYQKHYKNLDKIKLFTLLFTISAFLTSVFCAFFYEAYDVPYFLYFTHLSVLIVAVYYLTWFVLRYYKPLNKYLKHLDNFYLKGFVVMNIFLTGTMYMLVMFPSLIVGYIIGTFVPKSFAQWFIVTLAMHLFVPLLVWVDFRISKYTHKTSKYSFASLLVWPSIYASICLVYGTYVMGPDPDTGVVEHLFPYPIFDYINYSWWQFTLMFGMSAAWTILCAIFLTNKYKSNLQ